MLRDRLRTAAVLIAVLAILIFADAMFPLGGVVGLWLLPLVLFFALGTTWDFCNLLASDAPDVHPIRAAAMAGTATVTLSAAVPMLWPLSGSVYPATCPVGRLGWIVVAVFLSLCVLLLGEMRRYGKHPARIDGDAPAAGGIRTCGMLGRIGLAALVITYVGIPMALLVAMRSLGNTGNGGGGIAGGGGAANWGLAAVGVMIAVTKSGDTGAYFTGRALGRHKLIPKLSPGKTWEGAVGGVVFATLVAWLCLRFLMPDQSSANAQPSIEFLSHPFYGALVLGPVLAVAGMLGDLAESMVKRECGAKDSGHWLPGMGGVWDVTDSLIAASLPAYLLFASGVGW